MHISGSCHLHTPTPALAVHQDKHFIQVQMVNYHLLCTATEGGTTQKKHYTSNTRGVPIDYNNPSETFF